MTIEEKNMADVIKRLRASKLKATPESERMGYADGQRWASDRAAYCELRELADMRVSPKDSASRLQMLRSFVGNIGVSLDALGVAHYHDGFVGGALSIWDKVVESL